jgi:catechol 2,3-dioxygenase-like lactoylglutathione lyase family enzyme
MSRFSTGISEIVLIVADVARSAEFYENVVGLEPVSRTGDEWAWFLAGEADREQRIAVHKGSLLFEEHSPHPEGHRFGNVHFALEVPRDRLQAAVEHVKTRNVEIYGPTQLDWMNATSYYFYDPDGNLLEFWSPDEEGV